MATRMEVSLSGPPRKTVIAGSPTSARIRSRSSSAHGRRATRPRAGRVHRPIVRISQGTNPPRRDSYLCERGHLSRVEAVATCRSSSSNERASGDHDAFSDPGESVVPRLLWRCQAHPAGSGSRPGRGPGGARPGLAHVRALRDPEAWDAWLYRLTVRACYRLARTAKRRDVVELHVDARSRSRAVAHDFAGYVADRDRMGRELGRLPVDQRAVMVLHFYLDLPLTEAADDPRHPGRDREVPAAPRARDAARPP